MVSPIVRDYLFGACSHCALRWGYWIPQTMTDLRPIRCHAVGCDGIVAVCAYVPPVPVEVNPTGQLTLPM